MQKVTDPHLLLSLARGGEVWVRTWARFSGVAGWRVVSRVRDTLRYAGVVADPSRMDPPVARTGGRRAAREVTVHVRLTREASDYIDRLAEKEQRTRSDMVRLLLRRGMEHS